MLVTLLGMKTFVKAAQLLNAASAMVRTLVEIRTLVIMAVLLKWRADAGDGQIR